MFRSSHIKIKAFFSTFTCKRIHISEPAYLHYIVGGDVLKFDKVLKMLSTLTLAPLILGLSVIAVFMIIQKQSNAIMIPGRLSSSGNKQPTFIIAGLSNSGKTTLYNYLTTGKIIPTVMSQESNETLHYQLPCAGTQKTNFKLIDTPGHQKLHNTVFNEIKSSSKVYGIIFLIDSSIDPKKLSKSAHFLYEILLVSERRPGGIDILIGCNKSDLFSSRQSTKIKEILEQEIDAIRKLNASTISKVDSDINGVEEEFSDLGQSISSTFKFDQLEGSIDVISGSVLKKNIEKWECWIDERSVN